MYDVTNSVLWYHKLVYRIHVLQNHDNNIRKSIFWYYSDFRKIDFIIIIIIIIIIFQKNRFYYYFNNYNNNISEK